MGEEDLTWAKQHNANIFTAKQTFSVLGHREGVVQGVRVTRSVTQDGEWKEEVGSS
jgi:hypothetical protein